MWGIGPMGPAMAIGGLIALVIWIVILVWLAARVLRFIGLKTGWPPLDPRNLAASTVFLGGAIHLGNYVLDLVEASMRGVEMPNLGVPSAFLIGSVAIGVGIAAIRWHRKQRPPSDQ